MKLRNFISAFCFFCIFFGLSAQTDIEGVIVEKYYISDSNDATDTLGGGLEEGTVTYRIFIDLAPGRKIRKIYGAENHPLIFSSTENFFNNKEDGQSFADQFNKSRLDENTVALDSWLALGKITTSVFGGVLKENDTNGSLVAGIGVNDGGSSEIADGLLNNTNPEAGIPLSEADGLDTLRNQPGSLASYGIVDLITGQDSTIFGSIIPSNYFGSTNVGYQCSGATGVDSLLNHVIIAQLTTKGELAFEINLEVERPTLTGIEVIKYVANNEVLSNDEVLSPFLKYPPQCGCTDPDYLEFSEAYSCLDQDSCRTLIVLGCTDPLACNYDPQANFNIQNVCCYIGNCNDLDISLVCPNLSVADISKDQITVSPNPAQSFLQIQGPFKFQERIDISLFNSVGSIILNHNSVCTNSEGGYLINDLNLIPGIYYLHVKTGDNLFTEKLIFQ
jgi:hypothetical protein